MMMRQRLDARGTLAKAVEELAAGELNPLLSRCKRVKDHRVSVATGGYCQARQNLPKELLERSVEEILQRLRQHLSERLVGFDQPVYILDGSSLQLQHSPELRKAYPPTRNQHGESHWPMLRIVVLQDAQTGMAERPCWGPMYGAEAVSEQYLAERVLDPLPPGAIIIGDRNFGIFATAYAAHQRGHQIVIRLQAHRAKAVLGGPISQEGEYAVEWRGGAGDRAGKESRPNEAKIQGRLVACRVGRGKNKQWLYLFTTLTIPADEVVALYGKRWNVETDLRGLKQTARLQRIAVQSVEMMEKELWAAVLAYHLVRAVMLLAARKAGVHPRQLSFTHAYELVQITIAGIWQSSNTEDQLRRLKRLIELVSHCKLPNRRKRRSFPRAVWGRGATYPRRTKTK
jgi:putative transposase